MKFSLVLTVVLVMSCASLGYGNVTNGQCGEGQYDELFRLLHEAASKMKLKPGAQGHPHSLYSPDIDKSDAIEQYMRSESKILDLLGCVKSDTDDVGGNDVLLSYAFAVGFIKAITGEEVDSTCRIVSLMANGDRTVPQWVFNDVLKYVYPGSGYWEMVYEFAEEPERSSAVYAALLEPDEAHICVIQKPIVRDIIQYDRLYGASEEYVETRGD